MQACIDETNRRRARQQEYNEANGITPESIVKSIDEVLGSVYEADYLKVPIEADGGAEKGKTPAEIEAEVAGLTKEMHAAAEALRFEEAAALRDRIRYLKKALVLATA